MAPNQKCTKCGKPAEGYRMALMHGPNGFRHYAVCLKCADKLGLPAPTTGGRQHAKNKVVLSRNG